MGILERSGVVPLGGGDTAREVVLRAPVAAGDGGVGDSGNPSHLTWTAAAASVERGVALGGGVGRVDGLGRSGAANVPPDVWGAAEGNAAGARPRAGSGGGPRRGGRADHVGAQLQHQHGRDAPRHWTAERVGGPPRARAAQVPRHRHGRHEHGDREDAPHPSRQDARSCVAPMGRGAGVQADAHRTRLWGSRRDRSVLDAHAALPGCCRQAAVRARGAAGLDVRAGVVGPRADRGGVAAPAGDAT